MHPGAWHARKNLVGACQIQLREVRKQDHAYRQRRRRRASYHGRCPFFCASTTRSGYQLAGVRAISQMVDSGGSKVGHILSARSVIVVTAESQPRCRDQCEERFMASGMKLVVYPVADLAQAKALYGQLLGVAPYVD